MKRFLLLTIFFPIYCFGQPVALTPTISPAVFQHDTQITVTYNVTGTSLANLTNAWAWVWLPDGTGIDARYNITPATSAADPAKFTKSTSGGNTYFSLTFVPSDFFVQDISAYSRMGILLKAVDWSGGQTTDYLANFGYKINLIEPASLPVFATTGQIITIKAQTPIPSNYELFINEVSVNIQTNVTQFVYEHQVTETTGYSVVRLAAEASESQAEVTFQYIFPANSPEQPRPSGIISGINYDATDNTKATLCLWAPGKSSVYVRGDFSNWDILGQNILNRDGEYFWIELTGLTPGQEYAYQYLIDRTIWVADPYADKILDPNDQYIPATTYPDLKSFPAAARNTMDYFNRLAVLQTNQQPYPWQVPNFQKPEKDKMVIYELLIRDFFGSSDRTYQNLIDTLGYFKKLGVNTIQLMPIMEFNGNESWGYNPTFMFAPDKAYGTKNDLKRFIDACHQNGLAVILDIAMNHQDTPNPYAMLDFDFTPGVFRPTVNNKWFNVYDKHPYGVFFDLNHESSYTKAYLDTVNHYWLNEYKIDGYRFDLSKGFTQNERCGGSSSDENCIGQYDASRIAILKRMADAIWSHTEDAIIILEHFADNTEEKELAEYRINEGKGMMLWGNVTSSFAQNTMGYGTNADIGWSYYGSRGWAKGHLVSYMESHDEERMMFRNMEFGNALGSYTVKNLQNSINRIKAMSTMFYATPGAKMLWQFGELGYDYQINYCDETRPPDGECRTYNKPVRWDYRNNAVRYGLYTHISDMLRLRNTYDVFTEGTAVFYGGTGLQKQLVIRNNPYVAAPTNSEDMNVVIATNFDVSTKTSSVPFPHAGTWYEYYTREPVTVTGANLSMSLRAGEYKLFTDVEIAPKVITGAEPDLDQLIVLYPNPAEDVLMIQTDLRVKELKLITMQGSPSSIKRLSDAEWDIRHVKRGIYVAEITTTAGVAKVKVVKK